jgi:peroxiredoxin
MTKTIKKRSLFILVALVSVVGLQSFAPAEKGYKVGDKVADFSLKNTVDGKMVSLYGLQGATKGAIVMFTCNHCPFAKKYEQRIMDLDKKYAAKGFPVLAISPNDPSIAPDDSYDELGKRAKEKAYTFPYTFDESQEVARSFGALKTPHAFLVAKEGNKWIVKYIGAIDDNTDEPEKVTKHYLGDAIDALLSGQSITTTETKAIGCSVKWKKS